MDIKLLGFLVNASAIRTKMSIYTIIAVIVHAVAIELALFRRQTTGWRTMSFHAGQGVTTAAFLIGKLAKPARLIRLDTTPVSAVVTVLASANTRDLVGVIPHKEPALAPARDALVCIIRIALVTLHTAVRKIT
jgi:hypothetical protein